MTYWPVRCLWAWKLHQITKLLLPESRPNWNRVQTTIPSPLFARKAILTDRKEESDWEMDNVKWKSTSTLKQHTQNLNPKKNNDSSYRELAYRRPKTVNTETDVFKTIITSQEESPSDRKWERTITATATLFSFHTTQCIHATGNSFAL
jgi:hypothetical protein